MPNSSLTIPLVDLVAQYKSIQAEIDEAVAEVITEGHFIGGEKSKEFAAHFARLCEVPFCVPCANGTDALEIAFAATLEAVCNVGATPVLCDIDPDRYTIDTEMAINLVTSQSKIFMPVHLY